MNNHTSSYDVEKGVHEENPIRQKGRGVQQHRLRWPVERVGIQNRLNHDQRLRQIFLRQGMTVEGRLVWTIVEDLERLVKRE